MEQEWREAIESGDQVKNIKMEIKDQVVFQLIMK